MTDERNAEPCAVSFDELRRRALAEFQEGVGTYPADAAWALERQLKKIDAAEAAARGRDKARRGREPVYTFRDREVESIPITDESGVSVGAGRLVPRMPAEVAGSAARRVEPEVQRLITDTVSGIGAASVPNLLPAGYLVGAAEFAGELLKARRKFPTQASAHEGFAIIAEEMDELKAIVWQKQSERDYAALRKETVQLGAMVLAFLLEVVNPENRR